jgi:hypothetical protein
MGEALARGAVVYVVAHVATYLVSHIAGHWTAAQSLDIQDALPLVPLRSNAPDPRRLLICVVCIAARVLSETSAKGLPSFRGSPDRQLGLERGPIRTRDSEGLI